MAPFLSELFPWVAKTLSRTMLLPCKLRDHVVLKRSRVRVEDASRRVFLCWTSDLGDASRRNLGHTNILWGRWAQFFQWAVRRQLRASELFPYLNFSHQATVKAPELRWQQVSLDPARPDRSFKKSQVELAWPQLPATLVVAWRLILIEIPSGVLTGGA
jgi:hypothetical protein